MTTIPRYDVRVSTNPLGDRRRTAMMTPTAAGAGFGEALDRVGRGIVDVAEAVDYKDQLHAKADADTAYNQYMQHRRQVLYDPETGYLNTVGANALGESRSAALDELARRRAAVEQGLSPRALSAFSERANSIDNQVMDTSIQHQSNQQRTYTNTSLDAAMAASLEAAGLAYNDEQVSNQFLAEAMRSLNEKAVLNGLPPEVVKAQRSELISNVTAQRATNMAFEDPIIADQFLDANRDNLDPNVYRDMKQTLKPVVLQRKADQRIAPVFQPGGAAAAPPRTEAAAWQAAGLLSKAHTMMGMNEVEQNDAIRQYLADGGVNLDPAVTAWCAAFVNATLGKQGISGTSSNMARSFMDWGMDASGDPQLGDIVVLERGKPPFGHVGFFNGYDENGNMRITGGNQGDAVSTASYDPGRVLAVRRPSPGNGGVSPVGQQAGIEVSNAQLGSVLEDIMNEPDLELREALLTNFETRVKARDQIEAFQRRDLMDQAYESIVAGGNPDQLPPQTQIKIGAGGMASLREAFRNKQNGTDITIDGTYQHIFDMSISRDPIQQREFLEMNLNDYAGELSSGDLTQLKTAQREMQQFEELRNSGRASEIIYERSDYAAAAESAKDQFQALTGVRPGASASKEVMRRWNNFNSALTNAMRSYANENGQQMPSALLDQTIGALLMPVTIDPPGAMNIDRDAILADAPFRPAGSSVDTNLSATDIPFAERERITLKLNQLWQRTPTEEEVVDQYEREALHRVGLRPELEFEDIPASVVKRLRTDYPTASREQLIDHYLDMMVGSTQE